MALRSKYLERRKRGINVSIPQMLKEDPEFRTKLEAVWENLKANPRLQAEFETSKYTYKVNVAGSQTQVIRQEKLDGIATQDDRPEPAPAGRAGPGTEPDPPGPVG